MTNKMTRLVLQLKQGDQLRINGSIIDIETEAKISIRTKSRFVFGKQVSRGVDKDDSMLKRLYYHVQESYVGSEENYKKHKAEVIYLIRQLKWDVDNKHYSLFDKIQNVVEDDDEDRYYSVLKELHSIILSEEGRTK